MTESWVQYLLGCYSSSPVCAWQQLLLIPNCTTAPCWWEADLLAISRAGYCTEVEIKCTMADWKADQHKGKHGHKDVQGLIKRFYYAGPMDLMKRFDEVWTRPGSGIIGVDSERGTIPRISVLREPENSKARKLTEKELILFGRTAMVRYWTWAAKRGDPDIEVPAEQEVNLEI